MPSKKQPTELYLMGSKHEQNDDFFNYGMLIKVLEKIRPELILEEKPLDWEMYNEEWTTRNDCMVESAIKWLAELQPGRAVIITGATHIYYLLDKLQPLQAANNFKIIDIRKFLNCLNLD